MNRKNLRYKILVLSLVIVFCCIAISPALGSSNILRIEDKQPMPIFDEEIFLPPPQFIKEYVL